MKRPRMAIVAMALSAAGFVGLVSHEGYTDQAVIPVKGDRWTYGFGMTFREDGTPVRPGDRITPTEAVKRSLDHIARDESRLKQCVTAPLTQAEYDTLVGHAYQYGVDKTCGSSIVRLTNAGRYEEACNAYLQWKFVAGRDCSIRSNGCYGVWLRSQERQRSCLGETQ